MREGLQAGSKHAQRLLWLSGLAFALLCLCLVLDAGLSQTRGGDGPSYLILAKSLALGQGYSDINIPGQPPHTQYPPLFPLLLAPVYYAFGYNFLLMKLLLAAFALGALICVRAFFSSERERSHAIFIALLTGTNFYYLYYTNEIRAEIPFAFLSLLALLYAKRRPLHRVGLPELALIFPALLALVYMTRTIGVTLVAAAVLMVFLSTWREGTPNGALRKAALLGGAASVPFALWTLRGSLYSKGVSTYGSIFGQADYYSLDAGSAGLGSILERFLTNAGYYFDSVSSVLIPFIALREAMPAPVLFLVFLLALAGFFAELGTKREMKDFYFLFYIGLLTIWPVYGTGDAKRYLVPMIPFIYHYLLRGLSLAWDGLGRVLPVLHDGRARALLIAPVILLAINSAEIADRYSGGPGWDFDGVRKITQGRLFREVRSLAPEDIGVERFEGSFPCYYTYLHAAFRMKGTLGEKDVVMTRKPEEVYLVTGSRTVRFPYTANASVMEDFMRANGVNFVLLDSCYEETDRYLRPYLLSRPEGFRVVLTDNKGTAVLRQ